MKGTVKSFFQRSLKLITFSYIQPLYRYGIGLSSATTHVMKQFGLKQIVPPRFTMPIVRRERTFRSIVNYAATMDKDIASSWGARAQLGLQGEVCAAAAQSDEYMEWYGKNTLMFIGRGEATEQPAVDVPAADVLASDVPVEETHTQDEPTIPQKHV